MPQLVSYYLSLSNIAISGKLELRLITPSCNSVAIWSVYTIIAPSMVILMSVMYVKNYYINPSQLLTKYAEYTLEKSLTIVMWVAKIIFVEWKLKYT